MKKTFENFTFAGYYRRPANRITDVLLDRNLDFAVISADYEAIQAVYVDVRGKEEQQKALKIEEMYFFFNFGYSEDLTPTVARLQKVGLRTREVNDAYDKDGKFLCLFKALFVGETPKSLLRARTLEGHETRLKEIGFCKVGAAFKQNLATIEKFLQENGIPYHIVGSRDLFELILGAKQLFISTLAWKQVFGEANMLEKMPTGVCCY